MGYWWLDPRCRYILSRLAKYLGASFSCRHRVTSNIAHAVFPTKCQPGYPGVLRSGDRIRSSQKHDIPRHGLPTCFALTVKIRLRTLSRYLVLVGGVLFFHWASRQIGSHGISNYGHSTPPREKDRTSIVYLPLRLLLLSLKPSFSSPVLCARSPAWRKNIPRCSIALPALRSAGEKWCGVLAGSN